MSERGKKKKRKYQKDIYHYDIDLKEKLKQYQRNYYVSKKIRNQKYHFSAYHNMSKKTLKFANDKINQNNFILLRNQLLPI